MLVTARRVWRRIQDRHGQSLIEFALVSPFIIVLILAVVDFGIAIDRRATLQHGVREGARFGAVGGEFFTTDVLATESDIVDRTDDQSQGLPDSVSICYIDENGTNDPDPDDSLRVESSYQYDFVSGFQNMFGLSLGGITMTPSAEARLEVDDLGISECT
jgi:TadE-like protein